MQELKPCPACGGEAAWYPKNAVSDAHVECTTHGCDLIGPSPDPDGSKWNAMLRRGEPCGDVEAYLFHGDDGTSTLTMDPDAAAECACGATRGGWIERLRGEPAEMWKRVDRERHDEQTQERNERLAADLHSAQARVVELKRELARIRKAVRP